MVAIVGIKTIPCPGHDGICPFCKKKEGNPRYIGGSLELKSLHEPEPIIDVCCHACNSNMKYKKKFYKKTSIS